MRCPKSLGSNNHLTQKVEKMLRTSLEKMMMKLLTVNYRIINFLIVMIEIIKKLLILRKQITTVRVKVLRIENFTVKIVVHRTEN